MTNIHNRWPPCECGSMVYEGEGDDVSCYLCQKKLVREPGSRDMVLNGTMTYSTPRFSSVIREIKDPRA